VNVGDDPFAARIAAFAAADDAAPPGAPGGGLVVVGSSSIRRWEDAQRLLSAWDPVQRGVGGARLADVAHWAEPLILRHRPAAVLLYAGTNDLADGRSADSVVDAYRCVAARLHAAQPGTPLLWVSITPTPARWGIWPVAAQVNARIEALADAHPSLVYVDGATTFLATGSPPDAGLFVADGLHLSPAGYTLWAEAILPVVRAHVPESARPLPPGPPPGTYVRVDLGPSDAENGHPAGVDAFGIQWNAWPGLPGGEQALAGEALRGLVGTRGEATGVDLVLSGGFRANGLRNGGLAAPDFGRLGTLAVAEATQDFFYTGDPDDPGGLTLQGLTPGARHTLRLFASRASADERRVTRFVVHGGGAPAQAEVTTTGPGVGADGSNANVGELVVLTGLVPDPRGRLHVDVQIAQGQFAYLNLMELEVEAR
jgi:lysophospholipase L1-like esterase